MEPAWYPVFPLRSVCFPGHPLPLRVFEERYQRLLEDTADRPYFVIALISHGEEVGGTATPYRVGTLVQYEGAESKGDFQFIQPLGLRRVSLEVFDRERHPYLSAYCLPFEDESPAVDTPKLRELEVGLLDAAARVRGGVERLETMFSLARERLGLENYSLFLCGCMSLPPIYSQRMLENRFLERRLADSLQILGEAR